MNILPKLSLHWLCALSFIIGSILVGKSVYMSAKAELAQYLIGTTWQQRQVHQPASKPWPWADIYAVAKIEVPRLNIVQYIMNDSSGEALAFGAGHLPKTGLPGKNGHSMVAGHRDSHFEFLQYLRMGDQITVTNYLGEIKNYRVSSSYQIDIREDNLVHHHDYSGLTLITCFPFNNLRPQGPLRWIVEAVPAQKIQFAMTNTK